MHKGAGYPGTAISEEQLAEVQASINALAAEFVTDVARGRGESPDRMRESADGRVFSAADAQARGLVDRITRPHLGDWTRQMATDAATDRAYLKSGLALCREFPKHANLINDALDKGAEIAVIRGDIAIAEKSAQDAPRPRPRPRTGSPRSHAGKSEDRAGRACGAARCDPRQRPARARCPDPAQERDRRCGLGGSEGQRPM